LRTFGGLIVLAQGNANPFYVPFQKLGIESRTIVDPLFEKGSFSGKIHHILPIGIYCDRKRINSPFLKWLRDRALVKRPIRTPSDIPVHFYGQPESRVSMPAVR
jgi:hypothetical protein